MKLLAYGVFVLGLAMGGIAGVVFFAAASDFRGRGCPGAGQCAEAVSVMVLTGCAGIAALVMIFAAIVLVRR